MKIAELYGKPHAMWYMHFAQIWFNDIIMGNFHGCQPVEYSMLRSDIKEPE